LSRSSQVIPNCVLFLHRIGIESEGTCSCQTDTETTQHFLFDCQLYHSLRLPILHSCRNIPWPPPLLFFTSSTNKLALLKSFIHNTKRLKYVNYVFCFAILHTMSALFLKKKKSFQRERKYEVCFLESSHKLKHYAVPLYSILPMKRSHNATLHTFISI
jgi:hypothetical protein